ncbi:integrase core domain-containing protein [Streptomyces sp. NPDC005774]|uniref:integrase core domain-containing protein n=1 Tax=Streptomyces sp. NPDC005774 TaxID=3364728 RepID=UPI0036B97ADA
MAPDPALPPAGPLSHGSPGLIEHHGPWRDADQVERAVVPWVGRYNSERLHSALDYLPPEEFETRHRRSQATANTA